MPSKWNCIFKSWTVSDNSSHFSLIFVKYFWTSHFNQQNRWSWNRSNKRLWKVLHSGNKIWEIEHETMTHIILLLERIAQNRKSFKKLRDFGFDITYCVGKRLPFRHANLDKSFVKYFSKMDLRINVLFKGIQRTEKCIGLTIQDDQLFVKFWKS